MKKSLLLLMLVAFIGSFEATSQCARISLIGEMTEWTDDIFMERNPEMPAEFTAYITVTEADDTDANGTVEMKFRAGADWANNWGATDFPTGTAILDGDNIPVPYGSYKVTFNCETAIYNYTTTCGEVGLIGEMTEWAGDIMMMRDMVDPDVWTGFIYVDESDDGDANGTVEMKFRQNADWAINWGAADFPTGTAVLDGDNIPVPYGGYKVDFNCGTGVYTFTSTCGMVGLIGEMTEWAGDLFMERDMTNPDLWHYALSLNEDDDGDGDGIVEMKFRQEGEWTINWGSDAFPTGTAVLEGANIPVPLDDVGISTDYLVTFNCSTGEYSFEVTTGPMSMIGAFNDWAGDVPMHRDMDNMQMWKLTRSWTADSEVKFRENKDWTMNWGSTGWPSGTGEDNGPNIPLVAGTYDVTFNALTYDYSFTPNGDVCGEIGMVGDFNTWGDDGSGIPTDVFLVRDPMYPSQFSLTYNFSGSTGLLFRVDAGLLINENVWGGTFPEGTGVNDVTQIIQVPGGKYHITFNCQSGDFKFERLGNAVTAPKVFSMTVDGMLDEADWDISNPVAAVIDGTVTDDLNEAYFGVTYNDEYLYVGINIVDGLIKPMEAGEIFIDGDKSGGDYDEFDVHLLFNGAGVTVIHGPDGYQPMLGFILTDTGYAAEVALPWAPLGVTPELGSQIGIDVIISDDDNGAAVDYKLAWNGGLQNYESTSGFGDMNFGSLSCGCISLYNETIGDVVLRNPTDMPTTYVGTYDLDGDYGVTFRKDMQGAVSWADPAFPTGTATLGGDPIAATTGRYRVSFDCLSGEYSFETVADEGQVAYAEYAQAPPTIDGDLSEYNLQYGMDAGVVSGAGPDNNEVTWGAVWDETSLYIGAKVVDSPVEGSGNPWDNDAIEFYFDGNNDKDGTYDADYDTQLILDALNESTLWAKADGAPIVDEESVWTLTSDGYAIELRLGWVNFDFHPGKNRVIGFSIGNNDSDNGIGRDYQTAWYGGADNWNNTAILGDIQLMGGPYYFGIGDVEFYNDLVQLFPNPTSTDFNLRITGDVFEGNVTLMINDLSGRTILVQSHDLYGMNSLITVNADQFTSGIYFINLIGENGERAVKKLIVR